MEFKDTLSAITQKTEVIPENPFLKPTQGIALTPIKIKTDEIKDVKFDVHKDAIYDRLNDGTYIPKYDNYVGETGNENRLALQQTAMEQWGAGLYKFGAKTVNYALDATVGTVYGITNAIAEGSMDGLYDNDFSNKLDDWNKRLDNSFANYYSDEQKSMGVLESMTTANFWANDVGGGLAFVAGALLPEIAIGAATGGASVPSSFAKFGVRLGLKKAIKEGTQEIVEAGTRSAIRETAQATGMNLLRAERYSKIGQYAGEALKTGGFIVRTSNFEAGMEARHNLHDATDEYLRSFKDLNGRNPSFEEYSSFLDDAVSASNKVYAANMAILSVSNVAMFGSKFGIGVNLGNHTKNAFNRVIGLGVNKTAGGAITLAGANRAQKILGNSFLILNKPIIEGVYEEGFQGVAGKTMQNYLKAKYDPEVEHTYGAMRALSDAFSEQYGTKEGWKEMTIGMIIGFGASALQGRMPDGLGKNSRKSREARLLTQVEQANKGQEILRNMDRTNSMMTYRDRMESTDSVQEDVSISNTLLHKEYIASQEAFRTGTEIQEDFNAIVDTMQLTQEQISTLGGVENAESYKKFLKENFQQDAANYETARNIVSRIGLNQKLKNTPGNMNEIGEALIVNIMVGKTALTKARAIAEQIDSYIGTGGIFDHIEHYNGLTVEQKKNTDEIRKKKRRLADLRKLAVKTGGRLEGLTVEGAREFKQETLSNRYKKYSKELVLTQTAITDLEAEIAKNAEALGATFSTESLNIDGTITSTPTSVTVDTMLEEMDKLNSYMESLRKSGKSQQAEVIEELVENFKVYSDAHRQMNSDMTRMLDTDFFSTKKAAGLVSTILGQKYVMSEETRQLFRENDELIDASLRKAGIRGYESVEQYITENLTENEELSEREKYRRESLVRTLLGAQRLQERMNDIQAGYQEAIESEQIVDTNNPLNGDTIRLSRRLNPEGKDMNNLSLINEMITAITSEIGYLQQVGTNDAKIEELQAEVEALKKKLGKQTTPEVAPQDNRLSELEKQFETEKKVLEQEKIQEEKSLEKQGDNSATTEQSEKLKNEIKELERKKQELENTTTKPRTELKVGDTYNWNFGDDPRSGTHEVVRRYTDKYGIPSIDVLQPNGVVKPMKESLVIIYLNDKTNDIYNEITDNTELNEINNQLAQKQSELKSLESKANDQTESKLLDDFKKDYESGKLDKQEATGGRNIGIYSYGDKIVKIVKAKRALSEKTLSLMNERLSDMDNVFNPTDMITLSDGSVAIMMNKAGGKDAGTLSKSEIESIPQEHWDKFEQTVRELSERGVKVDLTKRSNLFYDKAKGFQFLDIDNIQETPTEKFIKGENGKEMYYPFERTRVFPKEFTSARDMFENIKLNETEQEYYDGKLQALEQQPTSTTQSEIEDKKADIERRRQEELDTPIQNFKKAKTKEDLIRAGQDWIGVNPYDSADSPMGVRSALLTQGGFEKGKELFIEFFKKADEIRTKQINTKYDAELKALEQLNSTAQNEYEKERARILAITDPNERLVEEIKLVMGSLALNVGEASANKIKEYTNRITSGSQTREQVIDGLSKSFVDGIDQLLSVNQLANQEQSSSDTQTETNDIQSEIDKRYQEKLSELERKYNEERTKIESSMSTSSVQITEASEQDWSRFESTGYATNAVLNEVASVLRTDKDLNDRQNAAYKAHAEAIKAILDAQDTSVQITQGIIDKLKETGLSEDVLLLSTDEVNKKLKEIGVNEDLRKQIVGENAQLDETVRLNLSVARDMEKEGKDVKTIRLTTGWERGADGKWRYEIPDDISIEYFNRGLEKDSIYGEDVFVSDFLDPEGDVIRYYPQLRDIKVEVNRKTSSSKGSYSAQNKRITLYSKNLRGMFNKGMDKARSVLLHEIQHAIQEIEGFAKGGSPLAIPMDLSLASAMLNDELDKLRKAFKPVEDNRSEFSDEYYNKKKIEIDRLETRIQRIEDVRYDEGMDYLQKYKILAGEVESRNVQKRMSMTSEQRREVLLQETEDVARDEQIALFQTGEYDAQFQKALNNVGINLITNGFTYRDKTGKDVVVLNKDTATDETAIHEFSHIFNSAMRKNRPELYARGIELVSIELEKEESEIKDIIDYVKQTQPDLKGEALAEEILTQLTGVKGAELINSQKQSGLIDWIRSFFTEIGKMFGILDATPEQISTMTLQEFAKASAVQLLKGTNLGTKPDQKNSVDEISELISQKEQEIAKLQEGNSYTIATLDEYKRLQELSIKKQKRTLTPKEEMELAQLTEVVNDWALMTGTVVEGLSLADLILQKAVLENTIIADYDEVGEVTEKDVLEDVLLEETKTKSNYPYAQTYDGVTAVATKEGIEVSGIRPAEFAELAETDDFKVNAQGNAIITEQVRVEINARGKISILPTSKDLATNYNMVLQTLPDMAGVGRTNVLRSTFNSDFNGEMSPESAYDIKTGESVTLEVNPEDAYNQVLLNDYRASRASEPVTEKEISDALSEDTIYIDLQFEIEELTAQEKKATTDKKPSITKKKLKKQESLEKRYQTVKTILNKKQSKGGGNTEAAIQAIKTGLVIRVKNKDGKLVAVLKAIRNTKGVYTNEDIRFESMREQIGDNFDFIERLANTLNTENIPFEGEVTVSNVLLGHPTFNYTVDNGVYSIENRSITEIQAKSVVDVGYVQNGKLFTKSKEMGINTTYLNRSIRESSDNKVPFVVLQKGVHRIAYPVKLVQSQVEGLQEFKDIYESDATIISKIVALNTFMAQKGVDIKQTGNSFTVFNMTDEFFKSKMNQIEGMGKNPNLATWIDPKTTIISNLVGNATINIDIQNPIHSPKLKLDYSGLTVKGMPAQAKTDGKNTPASTIKAGSGMANFLNQCR